MYVFCVGVCKCIGTVQQLQKELDDKRTSSEEAPALGEQIKTLQEEIVNLKASPGFYFVLFAWSCVYLFELCCCIGVMILIILALGTGPSNALCLAARRADRREDNFAYLTDCIPFVLFVLLVVLSCALTHAVCAEREP